MFAPRTRRSYASFQFRRRCWRWRFLPDAASTGTPGGLSGAEQPHTVGTALRLLRGRWAVRSVPCESTMLQGLAPSESVNACTFATDGEVARRLGTLVGDHARKGRRVGTSRRLGPSRSVDSTRERRFIRERTAPPLVADSFIVFLRCSNLDVALRCAPGALCPSNALCACESARKSQVSGNPARADEPIAVRAGVLHFLRLNVSAVVTTC